MQYFFVFAGAVLCLVLGGVSTAAAQAPKISCADGSELLFGVECPKDSSEALAPRAGAVSITGRVTGVSNCRDNAQQRDAEKTCRSRSAEAAAPFKGEVSSWDIKNLAQTKIENSKSWDGKRSCYANWRATCTFEFVPRCTPGSTCPARTAQ